MNKQVWWWLGALVLGLGFGFLDVQWINAVADFVATVYTRLFKFLALPTVALAVTTTLISFGREKGAHKIFGRTLLYTVLTTLVSGFVALGVYLLISPGNLPAEMLIIIAIWLHFANKGAGEVFLPYAQKVAMGEAGRKKVEREFDRQIVVEAYMKEIVEIGC